MILNEYIPSYLLLEPYMVPQMLLLGDHIYKTEYRFPIKYQSIDIHGKPDIIHDLTKPIELQYNTIFNLGTLEHIWDFTKAFTNVLNAINLDGYYIGHHPVSGWENHCIHITDWKYINQFLIENGFKNILYFFTLQNGLRCDVPTRNCGQSIIFWCVYKKYTHTNTYSIPKDLCM